MIEELRIQNFRCLRDVSVKLGAFTVLIGPNDSGKSSVLDAIGLLGGLVRDGFVVNRQSLTDGAWRRDPAAEISWNVKGDGFSYEITTTATGTRAARESLVSAQQPLISPLDAGNVRVGSSPTVTSYEGRPGLGSGERAFRAVARVLTSNAKYRLDPNAIRRPSAPAASPVLTPSGDNLASVLDALISGADRTAIQSLEQDLRTAIPTLHGIALRTIEQPDRSTVKALEFSLAGAPPRVTIPASQASEGALMLTAFLALAYGDTPDLLLIEEPENGLHPSRMKIVIDMLRDISTGKVGNRARQVIVTTHNPILLNYVKADEVRIVTRDVDKGSTITPMTDVPDLSKLLEEFAVGELWYLLGEEGLLKAKRP